MQYSKPPISIEKQIEKLKERGLIIKDEQKAVQYLSTISYYRLRAYTFPFQDENDINHSFNQDITLEEIIEVYNFDRKLRSLVLDAIERIEISFRTQMIYRWAMNYGSHWHLESSLFRNLSRFDNYIFTLEQEVKRSHETFIKHYLAKYTQPIEPPSWMSLEVSSFGLLSILFQNLKKGLEKEEMTAYYGLNKVDILENWIHSFSDIRNICAHHGRLWNRRLTTHITIPNNPIYKFAGNRPLLKLTPYKLYPNICAMVYVLNIIDPNHNFKQDLKNLLESCPLNQEREMGFPQNWKEDEFWV